MKSITTTIIGIAAMVKAKLKTVSTVDLDDSTRLQL